MIERWIVWCRKNSAKSGDILFFGRCFLRWGPPTTKILGEKNFDFYFLGDEGVFNCLRLIAVMYFDQQISAPHTVCWSKSSISAIKQVFQIFSFTNRKKEVKAQKIKKNTHKREHLAPSLTQWLTPKRPICTFLGLLHWPRDKFCLHICPGIWRQ